MLINIHSFTRFVGFTRSLSAPFLFLCLLTFSPSFCLYLCSPLSSPLFLSFYCSVKEHVLYVHIYFPPSTSLPHTRTLAHTHSPIHIHAHKAHTHKTTIRTGTPLLMTHNTLLSALVYSCSGSRGISSVRSVFDAANTIGLITFLSSKKRGLGSRFRVFAASNI